MNATDLLNHAGSRVRSALAILNADIVNLTDAGFGARFLLQEVDSMFGEVDRQLAEGEPDLAPSGSNGETKQDRTGAPDTDRTEPGVMSGISDLSVMFEQAEALFAQLLQACESSDRLGGAMATLGMQLCSDAGEKADALARTLAGRQSGDAAP